MQAIQRTFSILRAIRLADQSAGVTDVARATGLPKSTVSRLLTALEDVEAVERLEAGGGYVLGPTVASLASERPRIGTLREVARAYLRELTDSMGESSGLTVADGGEALYVDHIPSDGWVQTRDWTGTRFPLHTVAGGLAILMTWSETSIDGLMQRGLEAFSTETVTSKKQLTSKLSKARRAGYIWTLGDFDLEINGVGAPVIDRDGSALGAITVYGPSYRFPGNRDPEVIGKAVSTVANLIRDQVAD